MKNEKIRMTNKDRVDEIQRLLGLQDDGKAEYARVADVLCDLRHYCDAHNINFNEEEFRSEEYYEAERDQDE